jgi:betaine-aldehyde dehydrogenase
MAGWKILPAIAAGNTIVLKPSELTPGTSLLFAETVKAAGIPDGVVNIVTGTGAVVGEHLVRHPDVAMVSFTGSTSVGRHIMGVASATAKRVHLELGGKAPFLVFDDADIEAAAHGAVAASVINAGQDCTAATRAYIQSSVFTEFTARVAELMNQVVLGDPADPRTDLGTLITHAHRDRVSGFVERARGYGARILAGGHAPGGELSAGAFYRPTLVVDVAQDSEIVREEIFGPVLTALPFNSDDDGIVLANDTPYGLAASAWTHDLGRSLRAGRELQSGCVWINEHIPIVSEMPHGGFKASGFGKDMSSYSLEEYTNVKHVVMNGEQTAHKTWHDIIFSKQ